MVLILGLKFAEECVTEKLSAIGAKDIVVCAFCYATAVLAKVMSLGIVNLRDFLFGVLLLAKAHPNFIGVIECLLKAKL
jgi:hypothetical protein